MRRTIVFNGWAAGPETWELCAFPHDWVFDYIEQLDGEPERVLADFDEVVLVGFSMGGSMALNTLLREPRKVKGLVLISSTARMMEERDTGWKGLSPRRLQALCLGARMLFGNDPSPIYASENMDRGIDFLKMTDLRDELCARRAEWDDIKVEILQSVKDGIVRADNATFLAGVFPRAHITWVEGGEHVLPVSAPELVDAAVERVCSDED